MNQQTIGPPISPNEFIDVFLKSTIKNFLNDLHFHISISDAI